MHAYLGLDEPVILIDDVLVVCVVEGVALPHGPGVLEQRVRHGHAPDGVRSHDGRRLPGREVELVAEEVQRRVPVTFLYEEENFKIVEVDCGKCAISQLPSGLGWVSGRSVLNCSHLPLYSDTQSARPYWNLISRGRIAYRLNERIHPKIL